MDVDECIASLNNITSLLFNGRSGLSGDSHGLTPVKREKSGVQSLTAQLEVSIKELIVSRGVSASRRLNSGAAHGCKV
jgi:hypothetical protein